MTTFNIAYLLKIILSLQLLDLLSNVTCQDIGKLKCKDGAWIPDAKLIGFGLGCPLPLDGKSKSKGKTCLCGLKKAKLYDESKNAIKKDKISEVICGVLTQSDLNKTCKKKMEACVQVKGLFKDPKKDTEYKSWSDPFECFEKWVSGACKK